MLIKIDAKTKVKEIPTEVKQRILEKLYLTGMRTLEKIENMGELAFDEVSHGEYTKKVYSVGGEITLLGHMLTNCIALQIIELSKECDFPQLTGTFATCTQLLAFFKGRDPEIDSMIKGLTNQMNQILEKMLAFVFKKDEKDRY